MVRLAMLSNPSSRLSLDISVGLLLFFLFALPLLGIVAVWGSSEAREIHVVTSIIQNRNWILPLRDGIVPSKPIGFHWIAACLSLIVGKTSPALVRLISLLAGFFLVLIASIFAYGISSRPQAERRTAAFCAGVVTLSSYLWLRMAVDARVDMLFAAWVSAAICAGCAAFGFGKVAREDNHLMLYPFWICCIGAVLTKGPLGLALPVIMVGAVSFVTRGLRRTLRLFLTPHPGWMLFASSVLGWYLLAIQEGGQSFLWRQLLFENLERITGNERMNSEPFWYYVPEFFRVFAPWSFIVLGLLVWTWWEESRTIRVPTIRNPESSGFFMMFFGIAFFSLISGKRSSYLLPLLPVFAASTTFFLWNVLLRRKRLVTKFLTALRVVVWGVLVVALLFLLVVRLAVLFPELGSVHWELARWWIVGWQNRLTAWLLLFLVCGGAVLFFNRREWLLQTLFVSLGVLFFLQIGLGLKGQYKGFELFSESIKSVSGKSPEAPVVAIRGVFDEYMDPVLYYLGREAKIVQSCSQLHKTSVLFGRAEEVLPCCQHAKMNMFQSFAEPGRKKNQVGERLLVVGLCKPISINS
jgi:4-amino-4-deoxy-L-arabinose transferase-like glycosyltransferase